MDGGLNEIRLYATDQEIEELIDSVPEREGAYTVHYNQNEDSFIQTDRLITVPHFPIHHDVRVKHPTEEYRRALLRLLTEMTQSVPQVFRSLNYFFDPGDIHRPGFFQFLEMEDTRYLYLLRVDLRFRTHEGEMSEAGTNDITAEYRTNKIFLEGVLIPIDETESLPGGSGISCLIHQMISQTWIGETGRGYLIQGIWMDHELTKFFSKLFVPQGTRFYPYYPFVCRYRTMCHIVIHLSPEGRLWAIPSLHYAIQFLEPEMRRIEGALRNSEFSESLPLFKEIKERIPDRWDRIFRNLKVRTYLNTHDMKEFLIEA